MAIDAAQSAGDIIYLCDRATQALTYGAAGIMSEELLRGHRGHGVAAAAAAHLAVISDVGGATHMDGYEVAIGAGFTAGAPFAAVPSNVRKAAARAAKLAWDAIRGQHRCNLSSSREVTLAMFDATQTDATVLALQNALASELALVPLVPLAAAQAAGNLVAGVVGFSWRYLSAAWKKSGSVPGVPDAIVAGVHYDAPFSARVTALAGHLNV